ncbi:MAG: hypothetical protein ACHBNF_05135 [Chromatiales bacterium]
MRFRLHPELRALRVKNGSDMTTALGEEALPLKMASDRSIAGVRDVRGKVPVQAHGE